MIVTTENSLLESSGTLKKFEGGIGDSAKIIQLLRNELYENPIKALIRELLTNARDANREAKKPNEPVVVTLPSELDPYLRIRDKGPGISPERLEKIYLQYGNSTKNDSNTQTGGFGIGAKSPHSYIDSFNIITVTDGVKRSWSIPREDKPVAYLLCEEETIEENGTIVEVPMKSGDTKNFRSAYTEIVKYWDPLPIVQNNNVTINRPKFIFIENEYIITGIQYEPYNYSYSKSNVGILIDQIYYPVTYSNIHQNQSLPYYFDVSNEHYSLFHSNILFPFAIGQLSLTLSRDHIHFDEPTIEKIDQRIRSVFLDLKNKIQSKIDQCKDYFEAVNFSSDLTNSLGNIASKILLSKISWKGVKVHHELKDEDIGKYCRAYVCRNKSNKHWSSVIKLVGLNSTSIKNKYLLSKSYDLDRKKISALFPNQEINIICIPDKVDDGFGNQIDATYDQEILKIFDLQYLEDLKLPPHIAQQRKKSIRIKSDKEHTTIIGHLCLGTNDEKYSAKLIPNSGGAYIEVDVEKSKSIEIDPKYFQILPRIAAFTPTRTKHLSSDWLPLEKAYQKELVRLFKDFGELDIFLADLNPQEKSHGGYSYFDRCESIDDNLLPEDLQVLKSKERYLSKIQENSKLIFLKNHISELENVSSDIEKYKEAFSFFTEYKDLYNRCLEKYSLIKYIDNAPADEYLKYLKLVDEGDKSEIK